MRYPVAARALKKWCASNLERRPSADAFGDGAEEFTFTYEGSTCNNGGTPYRARLHVVISDVVASRIIEEAWIEIPEDQKEAASRMCAAPGTGAADAESFFSSLAKPADFVGRGLEEVITAEVPLNYAGCFCGKPHINQKWKIVLSTIHYALSFG